MVEQIKAIEEHCDKVLSFLEGLEAAARQKLDEQSDAESVDRIVSTAGYD